MKALSSRHIETVYFKEEYIPVIKKVLLEDYDRSGNIDSKIERGVIADIKV